MKLKKNQIQSLCNLGFHISNGKVMYGERTLDDLLDLAEGLRFLPMNEVGDIMDNYTGLTILETVILGYRIEMIL